MYKVFVNEKPIIITSSSQKENNFPVYILKNIVLDEIIHKLRNEIIDGVYLYTPDLESGWNYFLTQIKVVPAAGGLVKNNKNDILFIYRNNIWDLPKGRIEKNESIETAAIREVEEECSIFNLTIEKQLITTYHIYFQNKNKLKLTYWFLMNSNYDKPLIPQIEEGITKVEFIKEESIDTILKESYANIRFVYYYYKDN
jgi:ADP-ribose pyrophosphatase YjhB (NUDIX family)